jgi:hypothetical protein
MFLRVVCWVPEAVRPEDAILAPDGVVNSGIEVTDNDPHTVNTRFVNDFSQVSEKCLAGSVIMTSMWRIGVDNRCLAPSRSYFQATKSVRHRAEANQALLHPRGDQISDSRIGPVAVILCRREENIAIL